MVTLSKVKSTAIESGKRILKVLQYGIKTAVEVSPFGDDSCPVDNMSALYASTAENGEPVIVGYINNKQLAAKGEKRLYSLDSNGDESFYIWLKNNGTLEIGGIADNAVRYTPLNVGLQAEKDLINLELAKIAAAITTLGGTYVVAQISVDVSGAKIDEIKVL